LARLAEGLVQLGRVDGMQPHGELAKGAGFAAAKLEGVAVADGDDQAEEGGGKHEAKALDASVPCTRLENAWRKARGRRPVPVAPTPRRAKSRLGK
jgi:hypothetical protein